MSSVASVGTGKSGRQFVWTMARLCGYAAREATREMLVGVVSASFFGFFDAPPALGRYFSAQEDLPPSGSPVSRIQSSASTLPRYSSDEAISARRSISKATRKRDTML